MVYGLTSFGFSLNYFYCCGKLKEVTVKVDAAHQKDCSMKMDSKKCCDNKSLTLKISSDQKLNPSQVFNILPPASDVILPQAFQYFTPACQGIQHPQFYNIPPPLPANRTVLYSNFRI